MIALSIKDQRRNIIEVAYRARQGHLSSAMSVLEILNVIYKKIMKFDVKNPDGIENDKVILSKGHAALAQYAILLELGCISEEQFYSYSKFNSILGEHPDSNKVPGICVSTGSLGHGLPNAVGMAAGYCAQGMKNRVFVIIGDGEANEGSIWEAAAVASQLGLTNIICIADDNNSASHMPELGEKFSSFGWSVIELPDGHDVTKIEEALSQTPNKPLFIWAHTTKGHGCRIMEKDPEGWHHHVISEYEYNQLMGELQ